MRRIENPDISYNENGIPFSDNFNDIYFLPRDGVAETQTVFLQGSNLPQAWQGLEGHQQDNFTIAETGFGTGLNFLCTADLFQRAPGTCRHLHFISVERYPLSREQLATALLPFQAIFPQQIARLVTTYPLRIPGFHRIRFNDTISLTLIFDDAAVGFNQLDASVDAWFLDGFTPAKNPELWNDVVYQQVARLSHSKTTLASFTAAGHVRRGLQAVGFHVERQKGYSYKPHRITGHYAAGGAKQKTVAPKSVAIIGAGLMGATLAQALLRQGINCTIFDKKTGPGLNASSNQLGLMNPKIDLGHAAVNDLGQSMYGFALSMLRDMADIDFQQQGAFHPAIDDTKQQRQTKMLASLDWLPGHVHKVTVNETQQITGLSLPYDGLFFADSATVNTGKLVRQLLQDQDVRWNTAIYDLQTLQTHFDAVIIASAEAAMHLIPSCKTILQPMRGQVTFFAAPTNIILKCPIVAGHYVTAVDDATWVTGATFQRQRTDILPDAQDDLDNMAALQMLLPSIKFGPVTGHWAQIRYTTPDRRPVLGQVAENTYTATALGSHGLQYSFILAEILAAQLSGAPLPVAQPVLRLLDLNRYQDAVYND